MSSIFFSLPKLAIDTLRYLESLDLPNSFSWMSSEWGMEYRTFVCGCCGGCRGRWSWTDGTWASFIFCVEGGLPEVGESEGAGVGHFDGIQVVGSRPWEMPVFDTGLGLCADGHCASHSRLGQLYVVFVGTGDLLRLPAGFCEV